MPLTTKLMRCRVCKCTENAACAPTCHWVLADLCSVCAETVSAILHWQLSARRPSRASLLREVDRLLEAPKPLNAAAKKVRSLIPVGMSAEEFARRFNEHAT